MSAAEHVAAARRVDAIESVVGTRQLVLFRSTFVIFERGHEPDYKTTAEVLAAAEEAARNPPVRIVQRRPGLSLLIDPVTSTRKLRHRQRTAEALAVFDDLAAEAKIVDVEIPCYAKQYEGITSDTPITAMFGGNRAGKSVRLGWWAFHRWMLRGKYNGIFWWIGPVIEQAIAAGAHMLAGTNEHGDGALWPVEAFASFPTLTGATKSPEHVLIDGSRIRYKHAHGSGRRGGDNLKSANVIDIVVDELTAINDQQNWQQIVARVSQQAGHVATATTRKPGHWSTDLIEGNQATAGGAIEVFDVDLFDNPWMAYAAIWQLFLTDRTFTAHQLEEILALPRDQQAAAARARVTRPASLLNHFGVSVEESGRLWTEWTGEQILADRDTRHPTGITVAQWSEADRSLPVERRGPRVAARLHNITAEVLAARWRTEERFSCWAGLDFNFIGHAIVFELFGSGRTVAEAVANASSWVVLAVDEVEVTGSTLKLAESLAARTDGKAPAWCDPTGAMNGSDARGTGGSTDVAELVRHGFRVQPANGVDRTSVSRTGGPRHLSVTDSRNVLHRLHHEGRFFVHVRCTGLLDAFEHDQPTKTSGVNSPSDRRSGFSDAARYGSWPIFSTVIRSK